MLYGLDTETTGLDFYHGCKPFFVSFCDEEGNITYFHWRVDPYTRQPIVPEDDLYHIIKIIEDADELVLQNGRFDIRGLYTVLPEDFEWPWEKTHDTLIADHLLASSAPHDLTSMCIRWLRLEIGKYEEELAKQVKSAMSFARRKLPDWMIAGKDNPTLPSCTKKGDKKWKNDMWLPYEIACHEDLEDDHPWYRIPVEYGTTDSAVLIPLWSAMKEAIVDRDLYSVYEVRRRLLLTLHEVEEQGITYNEDRRRELLDDYVARVERMSNTCVHLSEGILKTMPKGVSNDLRKTIFEHFELPVINRTDSGNPSMDAKCVEAWKDTTKPGSKANKFVTNLGEIRKRNTAIGYLTSYERFALPVDLPGSEDGWYVLYPNLNPTGSDTLRFSSRNPNEQNISKKEGFNLRYAFGPLPGRIWVSIDYNNIELRIPAYESGEEEMIALFERPDDPPFFGSYHLLVASVLHPERWDECLRKGWDFKKKYASTWYQWVKNGNFAVQYGAIEASGTADRAYHMEGAQRKVMERFQKITQLNQRMIDHANEHGYVTTMYDYDIGGAYPIETPKSEWGRIKPTIPLNYHVQGTAMWAMCKAMNRVSEYLSTVPDHYMIAQIHDELLFDFPASDMRSVRAKVRKIKRLMEMSGDDIGVPLPAGVDYHPENWSVSS